MAEISSQAAGTPVNLWQRLAGVVFRPRDAFAEIVEHPRFWSAAGVLCAVSLILALLAVPKFHAFIQYQMTSNPQIPPEQSASIRDVAAMWVVIGAVAFAAISPFLVWGVSAVLLKAINLFAGERASMGTLFAVAVFAGVPSMLGSALQTVLVWLTPTEGFGCVTTSLAVLLPTPAAGQQPSFTYLLLARLDPFAIWGLVLLSLGGALAMKAGVRTVAAGVFGVWILYGLAYAFIVSTIIPVG